MKSGAKPTPHDHRDYDYLKSHHPQFKGTGAPTFSDEYLVDAGLTMPDQVAEGQPTGCTNFTQADLKTDLSKVIHKAADLEVFTHANALGGLDIRESLQIAKKSLNWFTNYFNVRASWSIDFFDAFRLAIISANPERRSITWGTPWFPSWTAAISGNLLVINNGQYTYSAGGTKQIIMPMPTDSEIKDLKRNPAVFPWHNSKLDGWTTRNGILVMRDKSWQGKNIGEGGFIFFPREVINVVMQINGTVAFTATELAVDNVQTVDSTIVQWIVSLIRNLFKV